MILISQLKISVNVDESKYIGFIARKLQVEESFIKRFEIHKKSIDARKKNDVCFVYHILVDTKDNQLVLEKNIKNVTAYIAKPYVFDYSNKTFDHTKRIAIIGFGPAGMFAALALSKAGMKVDVFERGEQVENRIQSIEKFKETRILNTESNIQFGEGGAGTFSDGKLTNRKKGTRGVWLFEELVKAGAPEEILTSSSPHIGTDKLIHVVRNIREQIKSLGSNVFFNTFVSNVKPIKDTIEITVNDKVKTYDDVILAIGHSSRDTIEMLYKNNIDLEAKPFAVGVRIEHNQVDINKSQYGSFYNHPRLGAAEYKLTHQSKNKRGVYSFCMCPGGWVVPSSSETEMLVVNGMSEYARNRQNANSAIVVQVTKEDFKNDHPLSGIEFQRNLERKAFILGGGNYNAPIQTVGDYLNNKPTTTLGNVLPSYPIGVTYSNLRELFPKDINDALHEALSSFGSKLKAFQNKDAILTGIETRTSSPVRITRDQTLESTNTKNLYPTGEGAGYAGGIVSAALDGIKVAERILDKYTL